MHRLIGRAITVRTGFFVANQDSFINEVTEEVRRDRLFALMRKYGWIAILLIVLLVGGAAVNEWRKASARAEAQAAGNALITALRSETAEDRAAALAAIETSDDPGKRAVIGLLQSAAAFENGDDEKAGAALDAISGDTDIPQVYRDLATLKRVMTAGSALAPEDRISRLQTIMQPGNPFRLLAIEQRAFAEVELGQTDAAIETLKGILADAERTEDLRRRAQQLIVALGGSLDAG